MIVKRKIMWNLIGKVDPNKLHSRLQENPELKNKAQYFNPLNPGYNGVALSMLTPFDGIKIDKLYSGTVTNVKDVDVSDKNISLNVNVEVYHMGLVYIEQVYELDAWCDQLEKFDGIMLKNDKGEAFSPSGATLNFIVNDLMCIQKIALLDDEYYNYGSMDKREVNKIMYDKYGFYINRIGASVGATASSWGRSPNIVLDENESIAITDQDEKISDDLSIFKIKSKNIYLTNNETDFNKASFDIKKDFIKSCFLLLQHNIASAWLSEINAKSESILNSIDNKNEVYWQNLRTLIEIWQLSFLSHHTNFYMILREFNQVLHNEDIFNKDIYDDWDSGFEKNYKMACSLFDQIQYGLNNLATPGHTHDEQRLQRETEKGNERILLLSFLAMSIPMIGAILTPTLSINLKLISGSVILFLPIIYILTRKITFQRNQKQNAKKYLKSEFQELEEKLDNIDKVREHLKEDKELPEDMKQTFFNFIEKSQSSQKEKLDKIDKKIKSI